ncbi:SGNH/GDSL hydrolase family protein [Actinokineospora pegani]|uniref:SGNH/GDSL hydrolase family protein n=1 Tax=Actinokineospora pegani TaxID=2654637 RepID=UPI0012EA1870|nr:SGNH/GDSL hydrolase family protein [Actinokineospora pegani]
MSASENRVTTAVTEEFFLGAVELEATEHGLLPHRLPRWAVEQSGDERLAMAQSQPSGVRLALRTAATVVEAVVHPTRTVYAGAPPRPAGVYVLVVDGEVAGSASVDAGDVVTVDMGTGAAQRRAGESGVLRFAGLPAADKEVEIWLPHNETTRVSELRTDAPVAAVGDRGRRRWVHYGSSISQGSNAAWPTGTWVSTAARAAGVDLLNLGFSGNALLDPFVARTIRDTHADLISVKIGINLVNADLMRLRALGPAVHGFLDTIRDGHPHTPLLVVTPLLCPIHEDTPGPGAIDLEALRAGTLRFRATGDPADRAAGKLTLTVVRQTLTDLVTARQRTDPALHLLDGLHLYGPADTAELPLPDDLHPDAPTHTRIGQRFTDLAFGDGGPFASR